MSKSKGASNLEIASHLECSSKTNFDLEVVFEGFNNCTKPNGDFILTEYLKGFSELCRFFKLTGRLFGFVGRDLDSKVSIIQKRMASKSYGEHYATVQSMIAYELDQRITHQKSRLASGSRTIIRLQRALEFILIFMTELQQSTDDAKVSRIAGDVYKRTLAKHHIKVVRKMAAVAVHMLPSRRQMFELMCKQEPEHVMILMGNVVEVAQPVYDSINALLEQHNLSNIP